MGQAWQFNVNEPYKPSGKLEGGWTGGTFEGGTHNALGGGETQSAFGNTDQSAFGGGTSAFVKLASSFGSSQFGGMPASAFTLKSRDSGTSNPPSVFGFTPQHSATPHPPQRWDNPNQAFGSTTSTAPSGFGQSTSAFAAKPSIIGSWSLPRPPTMTSRPRLLPTNLCPTLHPRRLRPLIKRQLCLLHPHIRPILPFWTPCPPLQHSAKPVPSPHLLRGSSVVLYPAQQEGVQRLAQSLRFGLLHRQISRTRLVRQRVWEDRMRLCRAQETEVVLRRWGSCRKGECVWG